MMFGRPRPLPGALPTLRIPEGRARRGVARTTAARARLHQTDGILHANEVNLRSGHPPYPPSLRDLPHVGDVTVVPALLVLLRKCVSSALGVARWDRVVEQPSFWV